MSDHSWSRIRGLPARALFLSTPAGAEPEAVVDTETVRLPVRDGKGIRFAALSTAVELYQTRVPQIARDDRGFMWFGTQYGLNQYDGYKFRAIVRDPRNPKSRSGVLRRFES